MELASWNFRGHAITFERRWMLSEDGKEVRILERVSGPKDNVERMLSVEVG